MVLIFKGRGRVSTTREASSHYKFRPILLLGLTQHACRHGIYSENLEPEMKDSFEKESRKYELPFS
jgi:hypothetical protein